MAVKNDLTTPGPSIRYWGYKWHVEGNTARVKPRILVAATGLVLLVLMTFVPVGIACFFAVAAGHWLFTGVTFVLVLYLFIVIVRRLVPEYYDQIPVTIDVVSRKITFGRDELTQLTAGQIRSIGLRTVSTISFEEPSRAFDVVVNCSTPDGEPMVIARFHDGASARRVARQAAAMLETSYREDG